MNYLTLGKILKTRGLDGTMKVFSSTEFASIRYKKGNTLSLFNEKSNERIEVTVKNYSYSKGFDYVLFEEIDKIELAEKYIGFLIQIDREKIPPLEDGYYFHSDLIGLTVFEGEEKIGIVKDVEEFSSVKSLRIKMNNGKSLLLPFIEVFIKKIDLKEKRIDVKLIAGMR